MSLGAQSILFLHKTKEFKIGIQLFYLGRDARYKVNTYYMICNDGKYQNRIP